MACADRALEARVKAAQRKAHRWIWIVLLPALVALVIWGAS